MISSAIYGATGFAYGAEGGETGRVVALLPETTN